MNTNGRNWARLAFFVGALFLSIGILVSALVSEGRAHGANEVMLLLAIGGLGLITYRELLRVLRAQAINRGLGDAKSNDSVSQERAAINDVRNGETGSLIDRLKRRRTLTLVVLLCVLSFPVALVGIPAVLDGRPLSRREFLLILFLQVVVVVGSVIAWRRVSRLLK